MKKSIFLFFAAIMCAISAWAATPTKIYLNAKDWGYSDARYAAYFFDPGKWVDMTKVDGETYIYEVDVPSGYTKVIFVRMDGSKPANDWANKWNQTGDLNIPTDGKNMFKPDDWNGKTTTWSTYTPSTPAVTHTFAKNSTLYVDFRAITDKKGANYPKAGSVGIDYSANAGGTVIPVTFTADVKWTEGAEFMKTEKGGWASIPFKAPEAGQNCAQVAADGKSYTWTTYSEPSVTLSLDKTEADAGTEVTVTLTATADNVSGEVTYAFQYSTDNATWNNITATGNTATQTFAAETRYYKVTMTNGGTTKEATAKFSAIKFHIIGSWDNWTAHNEVVEGSKTITLEANKTYEYKITNGTWDLSWGNDGTMERSSCTDWSFESNNNAKIKTDEAGDYVFNVSRNAEGKVNVSVTYPEQTETPEPVDDVYTVVGSAALCGSDWDPSDASNDMTLVDGLYVWTKENVTLTGNTTFKIVKNHDYGQGEWPSGYGQNATIDISTSDCTEGGTYSIKITFDPTTGTITPTIESCEAAEEPIVHTYTVVGQAVLCESEWSPSDASNDMTLVDGLYVWTKENVELRSNAEFRIVKDHAYDEAYPNGGNYVIDLANYEGAAIYDVTITFNAETKEIKVAMEKAGDVTPVVYTYYLMGVNGDWTTGIEMEVNTGAENEVMLTCQPVNGEVKIKRIGDDESVYWYGGKSLKEEEGNLGTNTEAATDGDGNIALEEGIYNFYFNTADGQLWIAAATDCETEPEYNVVEDVITNFVFDTEAWPMVCSGGPSTTYQVEVFLTLTEDADGTLAYEDCSVSIMGTDATFIDGTLSNIDVYAPSADAVLHVLWQEEYYELKLSMSAVSSAAPVDVMAADATVTFSDNEGALKFNGTNVYDDDAVYVELAGFEYNGAGEYTLNGAQISMFENTDAFAFADEVTVAIDEDGYVTVEGVYTSFNGGGIYNVHIWGALPKYTLTLSSDVSDATLTGSDTYYATQEVTVTATQELPGWVFDHWSDGDEKVSTDATYTFRIGKDLELTANYLEIYTRTVEEQWGTICLPYASASTSGATFYEVSSLVYGEGLWLDQLAAGTQLVAGKPYIFKATATEITVTYTGEAKATPVAGENGLIGTFTDIAAGSLTGNYIIAENKVWVAGATATLPAYRAYISSTVPTTAQAEIPGRRRVLMGENAATGVDNIVAPEGQTIKAIVNGQLVIIRGGEMYNVQGQKL